MAQILIGFAEAVPTPEVIYSLLDVGYDIRVFSRRGAGAPLLKWLPVGDPIFVTSPEEDIEAARRDLANALLGPDAPDAIFALDDPGLWLVNRVLSELPDGAVQAVHATGAAADIALDKIRQIEAARTAGLAVPETLVAYKPEDLQAVRTLPAIVKPALAEQAVAGQLSRGRVHYLLDPRELTRLLEASETITFPALIQPLVHGIGEGVFGFATKNGVVNWMGHERVRMMNPHGSGSSACRSLSPDAETRAKCAAMIQAIGWRGPFMIELLRGQDGRRWFMELNGRMWGSLALARRTGFDYPAWAVAQSRDADFVPPQVPPPPEPILMRHLGRELVHLLFVLRGPKSTFHRQSWPRFWSSLLGVLKPGPWNSFYNYDKRFPRFFWADAWSVIRSKLGRG